MSDTGTPGPSEHLSPAEAEALIRSGLSPDMAHRLRAARLKDGRAILVAEAGDLSPGARIDLDASM